MKSRMLMRSRVVIALILIHAATPSQLRSQRPRSVVDGDSALRAQAIAVLQGSDTTPFISEQRIALVARALRAIRTQFPRVVDIVPDIDGTMMRVAIADSAAPRLVAGSDARKPANSRPDYWFAPVTRTGARALDSLNAKYGAREMRLNVSDLGTSLYLRFSRPINVPVLRSSYERLPEVEFATNPHDEMIDSWIVLFDKGRTLDIALARGSGDCPAGCVNWDYYYVAYDTLTRTATMEREKTKDYAWSEPIMYWDVPSRLSINAYASFDSMLAATRDARWWHRSHALKVLDRFLGPAIGPWMGSGEQRPDLFTTLKRATNARQQDAYGAIVDRLTDPDPDVARTALALLRSRTRRSFAADSTGLAQWRRWVREIPNRHPPLEIRFLRVGQGNAVLVRQGPHAALVDAGPVNDSIVARLRALDVDSLQLLVASSGREDHIGSAAAILAAFPVGVLIDGGGHDDTSARRRLRAVVERRHVPERQLPRRPEDDGFAFTLGDARIEIIRPSDGGSPMVRIARGKFRAILAGDAGLREMSALASRGDVAHVDVMLAPRHGDTTAIADTWMRRLSPTVVVVSSADGEFLSAAHRQYGREGRTVASTYHYGDILVVVNDDGSYSTQSTTGPVF